MKNFCHFTKYTYTLFDIKCTQKSFLYFITSHFPFCLFYSTFFFYYFTCPFHIFVLIFNVLVITLSTQSADIMGKLDCEMNKLNFGMMNFLMRPYHLLLVKLLFVQLHSNQLFNERRKKIEHISISEIQSNNKLQQILILGLWNLGND